MPRRKNWKKSLVKSDGKRRVNLPSKKTEKMVNLPSKKTKAISIFADKENVEKTCQSTSQNVAQSTSQNVAQNTSQNVAQSTSQNVAQRTRQGVAQSSTGTQQIAAQRTEKFNSIEILQGSFNQGDDRFSEISRGSQCTANALTALLFAKYSNLDSSTALDDVLTYGDNLYLQIVTDLKISKRYVNNLLCFEDVPPCVEIFSKQIHIRKGDIISGCAITNFENNDLPTLHNALQTVLERVSSVLIIIGAICSAVFVHEDLFYFFDSHSHGSDGLSAPDGTALLISFEKLVDLISFMYACYESMLIDLSLQFDVMPLCFVEQEKIAKSCNSIEQTTSLIDMYFKDQLCKSEEKSFERENVCLQIPVKRTELSATRRGNLRMAESKRSKSNIERRQRSSSNEQDSLNEQNCKSQRKILKKTENVSKFQATDTKLYMKNYMKLKRENKQYREKELKSKRLARQNDLYRENEKQSKRSARRDEQFREKEKKSKRSARQDVQFREKEKQHELRTNRSDRQDEQFREKEKKSKCLARQDVQFREKEKQNELRSKRSARQDEQFREKEKQSKCSARQDVQFREKEKQNELRSKRSARQDEQFREKEKQSKRSARQDVQFREKEIQHELKSKRLARKDIQFKEKEKETKRIARGNENFRDEERKMELNSKKNARKRPIVLERERVQKQQWRSCKRNQMPEVIKDKQRKSMKRKTDDFRNEEVSAVKKRKYGRVIEECIELFHDKIAVGPLYVCSCCHQTWFKESVVSTDNLHTAMKEAYLTGCTSVNGKEWVCHTCNSSLRENKTPRLSQINGMKWPVKPNELKLFPLEERLISLRIPFMQIRELPRGGQYSLKGNVVNVPVDIQPTVTALPRPLDENVTIAVKLKRKISFQSCAFTENVRPLRVLVALHWLMKHSTLYKDSNVDIDQNWIKQVTESAEDVVKEFVSGTGVHRENVNEASNQSNNISEHTVNSQDESSLLEVDSDTEDAAVENVGNIDTLLNDENEQNKSNQIYTFAPGEGQHPLSLYQDVDSEYLCFPTIFCGQRRPENNDRLVPVHYSDVAKWELRSIDRRAAQSVPNVFFKLKKIQLKQISDKVQLALRRCKTEGKTITAAQARDPHITEQFIRKDEGYYIFRQLRNSPAYLETRKKDVFAMIRQLGLPTWFMSLSSADSKWTDLLKMLGKLNDNVEYTDDQISKMTWEQKVKLVQKDPVTCTRYFDHRVQQFIGTVLKSWHEPIGNVVDFFYRVEFQQRGSPHIHMLVWIEKAPKYGHDSNDVIVEYVDKFLTCSTGENDIHVADLIALQTHKHTKTCKKNKEKECRFGYPLPPLNKTMILEPLDSEVDKYKKTYVELQKTWNENKDDYNNISFNEFLVSVVKLSEEEYIKCIRSSLNGPKVFLKREPKQMSVNLYNQTVLRAWKANLDMQFVLDPYACAMYIVSYISKSQRGMSSLLDSAAKEARNGNLDLKKQVRHIGNVFSNSVEVGAQEAVYLVLQIPLTKSSREVVFINTSQAEERIRLIKSKDILDELPADSTDIVSDNIIQRYSRRPKQLENWCLADYVSQLEVVYPKEFEKVEEINDDAFEDKPEHQENEFGQDDTVVVLKNGIKIRKRTNKRIIRYVRFNAKHDEENHFREKLLLFLPWRDEKKLSDKSETFKERYLEMKRFVDHKCKEYEQNAEELEVALQQAMDDQYDAFDEVAPSAQQENADAEDEGSVESEAFVYFNPDRVIEHRNYDIGIELGTSCALPNVDESRVILSDEHYRELLRNLNCKQREFHNHIVHWIKTKTDPLFTFLSGGAGVGKSVLIKALYQTLYRILNLKEGENPDDTRILLCAFTGKAAFNINGVTIASAFHKKYMQSNHNLSCDELNTFRMKYRNLSVVIIDEISMVGNGLLNFIDQRLQELTGTKRTFGGVSIIAVGDLYQLMPVGDSWIFNDLTHGALALAPNLWQEHFRMFELVEIMRQKDDMYFAQLLNRLRHNALTDQDRQELKNREINTSDDRYPSNAPHLFTENKFVDAYNKAFMDQLAGQKITVPCNDTLVLGNISNEKQKKLINAIPDDASKTANLMKNLTVAVGMIYDISVNVNVEDGLTNGSTCEVKHIEYKMLETSRPSIIWVQFHDSKIGSATRKKFSERGYYTDVIQTIWTPIFDIERTFLYNFKTFRRIQFPLKPSAGKTIHKAQGCTVDEIVIDLSQTRIRKIPHIHYVALSRVRTLENLHILNFNEQALTVDEKVNVEIRRLRDSAKLELCYNPLYEIDSSFKVAFSNSRSLYKHFEDVRYEPNLLSADVIGIAESRLCDRDLDTNFSIPGFNVLRNDQNTLLSRPYHGLVLYLKQNINVVQQEKYSSDDLEFIYVRICEENSNDEYQLVVLYKSPKFQVGKLKSCLIENLVPLIVKSVKTVIIGDFNIDGNIENGQFLSFMYDYCSCTQKLKQHTTDYGTMIDLVFTNCQVFTGVIETYWSDHKIVYCCVERQKTPSIPANY